MAIPDINMPRVLTRVCAYSTHLLLLVRTALCRGINFMCEESELEKIITVSRQRLCRERETEQDTYHEQCFSSASHRRIRLCQIAGSGRSFSASCDDPSCGHMWCATRRECPQHG